MQRVIEPIKDCAEKVRIDYSLSEWLILDKALKQFANNEENNPEDRDKVKTMLDVKINFGDVEENADSN